MQEVDFVIGTTSQCLTKPMNSQVIQFKPPRIAMSLLLAAMSIDWLSPANSMRLYSSPHMGGTLLLSGFAIMIQAWWQFRSAKVAICPTALTDKLITDGVFQFTRNPMYLGIVTMLLGVAMVFGTVPFYAASVIFLLIMDQCFCVYEEQKLVRLFGQRFNNYRGRVRRWL